MAPSASPNAMNWNKMINPITSHDAFAILPENKTIHQKTPAFFSSCPSPCAKQTNKQTHPQKEKQKHTTHKTHKQKTHKLFLSISFSPLSSFFYLVRKQNKEIEDHTKMHYILHPSSANLQNVFATKQRSSWFVFLFFCFLYCKSLLPAASQTICQPPTLLLTTNWCNQTAINQPITQFFFPFPNALLPLLPAPHLPSASAHWLHEFIHISMFQFHQLHEFIRFLMLSPFAWLH